MKAEKRPRAADNGCRRSLRIRVVSEWNSPGTPVYYVIDPTGVIRYKWVGNPGEKALDAALDKLIQEAEKDDKEAQ